MEGDDPEERKNCQDMIHLYAAKKSLSDSCINYC